MFRRWFNSPRAQRKRHMAASAVSDFRFELLEQRTCMANDLDGSPLGNMATDVNAMPQLTGRPVIGGLGTVDNSTASVPMIRYSQIGSNADDVICLIEPTYEAFTLDIELCIDPSVGPRPVSHALSSNALTFSDNSTRIEWLTYRTIASATTTWSNASATVNNDSAGNGSYAFDMVQSANRIRPKVVDVPQTVVQEPEIEGEDPPVALAMHEEPASPAGETARNSKHGDTEHPASVRPAQYVASIDWHYGSTTELKISSASDADAAIASERQSWTGLVASRVASQAYSTTTPDQESQQSSVNNELRPLIAALPEMDASAEVVMEHLDDAFTVDEQHNHANRPTTIIEHGSSLAPTQHQLSMNTISDVSDASNETQPSISAAAALPLGVLLTVDEKTDSQPSAFSLSRPSRYWYLAAISAFFALPRRVRDRLPSIPTLKRAN